MNSIRKWTTTLCWIFISRFAGFSTENSTEPYFRKADSLKAAGQLEMARIEYERAGFFAENNLAKTSALLCKAECYLLEEKFAEAEKLLGRVNYSGLPDSMVFKARYSTAWSAYLAQHFTHAESQLLQLEYFLRDSSLKNSILFLHTLTLNELDKFTEAKSKLGLWISQSGLAQPEKDTLLLLAEQWYSSESIPKYKSVKKAQNLSMFLPGTGQWYAGYFWDGAASAGFQLAGLALLGYNIYTQYYITGVIYGFGIFQRFYAGGIKRTEFLVNKTNYKRKRKFNDGIKNELLGIRKQYGL